jgi:hypothetical protein
MALGKLSKCIVWGLGSHWKLEAARCGAARPPTPCPLRPSSLHILYSRLCVVAQFIGACFAYCAALAFGERSRTMSFGIAAARRV